jgi:fibronectin-binding autotransporter adhesin
MTLSWWRELAVLVKRNARRAGPPKRGRRPKGFCRPRLEYLEDRLAPAVFTVTNSNDSGAGSLRDAVAQANATPGADMITFDPSYFNTPKTIVLSPSPIALTDSAETTIQGPGAGLLTISGNNAGQVFNVTGAALLSGLTVSQGKAVQGGGIYVSSTGTLTLANCTISSSSATGNSLLPAAGGAIYDQGALTVTGCTFSSNSVSSSTTSQPAAGGAIYDNAGTLPATVTNSTFTGNTTFTYGGMFNYGGAIGNEASGTLTIANSTFTSNSASDTSDQGSGGAIFNDTGASLALTNSTLTNNHTFAIGGGIYNAGTMTVTSSTFQSNSATATGNPTGGAIANVSSGTLAVTSSTISGSAAYTGASIYNAGNLTVTSTTITSASAIRGGALYNDNGGLPTRTTTVTSSILNNNTASTNGGGGIVNASGTVAVANCTFNGNVSGQGSGGSNGAAILNQSSGTMTVANSTFDGNSAPGGGGIDNSGSMTVTNSNFNGDIARITGGGAFFNESGGTMTVSNSTFTVNTATTGGGAISNGGTLTLSGSTLSGNSAPISGAIENGATLTVTGSTFSTNKANRAGAIRNNATLNVTGSTFSGNFSYQDVGAGILNLGTTTVTSSSFSDNSANTWGGAIFNGYSLTVTSSSFYANIANSDGGAIYSQSTLTVTGSTFGGNVAVGSQQQQPGQLSGRGGAIYNDTSATLTVSSSTFLNNSGHYGGGIFSGNAQTAITVTTSTFSGNSASYDGGGINAGLLTVLNSTFNGNSASYDGGAISAGAFSGTGYGGGGGGGYGGGSGGYGPPGPGPGPGPGGSAGIILTCSTISGNSAVDGGGIKGGTLALDSTIVAANTATTGPDLDSSVLSTSVYNLIGNSSGMTVSGGTLNSTNQVGSPSNPINPQLDQLGLYGGPTPTMAVLPGSPAIHHGDPNATDPNHNPITTDQRGFSRGSTPDVGAYVSQTYTHFEVTTQQYATEGTAFSFTVAAVDQYNNLLSGYTGTVHFTSSDASASLPADYTFTTADQGMHTFSATLRSTGSQTLTATDTITSSATGSATVSVAPVLVVTNTNDSGTGSLRWAVTWANTLPSADTITFDPTVFGTAQAITLTSGPLTLTDSAPTTIQGPGASLLTVSGNNHASQVFVVNNGAAAVLSGLTISQGLASWWGNGGDIDNMGTLTLSGSTVSGSSGDGIFNSGTLTLTSVTVSGNSGGGILNTGTLTAMSSTVSGNSGSNGGGLFNSGTLTLTSCVVSSNSGGGVFNSGMLVATNSTVSGNTGGGIFNSGNLTLVGSNTGSGNTGGGVFNGGTLAVAGSTLSNNSATSNGGGIFSSGTLAVTSSTISVNSAGADGGGIFSSGTLAVTSSTLSGNSALYGGGIENGAALTVTASTFSGNTVNSSSQAAEGGGLFNAGTLAVVRSTLTGNSASSLGGGIDSYGTLTVTASTLSGNSATLGGGIDNFGGSTMDPLTVDSSIVALNPTLGASDISGSLSSGSGYNLIGVDPKLNPLADNGGPTQTMSLQAASPALNAGDPNATDQNGIVLITDQRSAPRPHGSGATPDIGAYDSHGAAVTTHFVVSAPASTPAGQALTFTVTAKDNQGNTVTAYAGTVHFTSSDSLAVLPADATLTGGVGTFSATLNTLGVQTLTASDTTYSIIPAVSSFAVTQPNFVVTNTNDDGSTGSLRWAVAQANALPGPATITFDPSFSGSPHTITLTSGPLTLMNGFQTTITGPGASLLTVSGNNASQVFVVYGGVTASLSGLTISQGLAPWWENGSGLLNAGTLTLTNDTLSGNSGGGALSNSGSLTLSGSTVSNNTAHGIFNSGTLAVTSSTISGNSATNGGGVFNSGTATVTTSTVSGNSGGGIFSTGTLAVSRSTLSGNSGSSFGGGISNFGMLTVTSSTLSGNAALSSGGGVFSAGTLVVTSSTLSNNTANRGSGIDNRGTLTLDSTIVAADLGSADVWGGAVVTSAYNLIGDGSTLLSLTNGSNANQIGTSASPINPLLGALGNNGGPTQTMALLSGSPALGGGDANAKDPSGNLLTADQRGLPRPVQGRFDIGAFESQ